MEADWGGLFRGLLALTLSVSGGLALGKVIITLSLPDRLFRALLPGLGRILPCLFPGVSLGSARAL